MRQDGGLDLDIYHQNDIAIIRADGSMNADNCIEVRNMVMDSLAVYKNFIIDCKEVHQMDSTAIGTLMSLVQEVQLMDGEVKLAGLDDKVRRIFRLANVERVFDLYKTVADAEAAFPKERVV